MILEKQNKVESYIKNQGYNYTYNQLSNLYLSLKTKPFTILAGISGTGKSKIIRKQLIKMKKKKINFL